MEINALEELLNDMSFEEKAGQLTQLAGAMYGADAIVTGLLDAFQINEEALNMSGSILSVCGAEKIAELQKANMEKQPHHIPQVFMYDIINGYQTIYPVPLGQGASFDPELVEKLAHMSANEGAAAGLHVTFSPMVDLVRDARWGRVMESTGEDPYLNSLLGAAMVRGYQGKDIKEKGNLAACVKHFAAYGGAEAGRDYDNVELSERTLREDYFPGYKAAIDAGAKLVMTSFNTLNRVPSTGNKWLMKNILREEMGFEGVLITDYGAIKEMINHGFVPNEKEAARVSMNATVDMEMMSTAFITYLKELIDEGKISMDMVDQSVMRILKLKNELGLFENPLKDGSVQDEKEIILCQSHRALAKEGAVKSFVLLKNEDNLLPINTSDKQTDIAFIGPYCMEKQIYGSWSFPENTDSFVTIEEGVNNLIASSPEYKDIKVTYSQGCNRMDKKVKFKDGTFFEPLSTSFEKMAEEAVYNAKNASTVVMCIGEHFMQTGEAASRTLLNISEEQMELLRRVNQVNKNIVTIVFAGRPIIMDEIDKLSKSVLYAWFPGTEGGNAIAEVLFGINEPGGRLPMSFSHREGQLPNYYNRFRTGRPNNGTLDQGFVMGYIDQEDLFMYPFGYGLTYSTFEYGKISLDSSNLKINSNNKITASIKLKNTGNRTSTETVQMYIQDLYGSVVRPVRLLKGFKKITLDSMEEKNVHFEITEEMLKFINIDMEYKAEEGDFKVFIGANSITQNYAEFTLS